MTSFVLDITYMSFIYYSISTISHLKIQKLRLVLSHASTSKTSSTVEKLSPLAFFALPLANELSTYCVCSLEDWETKDLREWKSSVNLAVKKNQEQVVFIGKSVTKKNQESQKKLAVKKQY